MHLAKLRIPSVPPAGLKLPAIVASVLVVPFMIMELVNRRDLQSFPIPLFGLMWLLPLSFIVILMTILRRLPPSVHQRSNPLTLVARIVLLVFIAWVWVNLTLDQMPCFLGVPNCD